MRLLCGEGWEVVGIDNDMRAQFFGPQGTTRPVVEDLRRDFRSYRHLQLDIRDRQGIRDLFELERPNFSGGGESQYTLPSPPESSPPAEPNEQ